MSLLNALSMSSKRLANKEQREAVALGKLQELEQCAGELESESEKVFRIPVQSRVLIERGEGGRPESWEREGGREE